MQGCIDLKVYRVGERSGRSMDFERGTTIEQALYVVM